MKWFDLSRFGAKLSVLPKSDARAHTVLRLEMKHSRDWANQRLIAQARDPSLEGRFTPERFYAALADLGFSEMKPTRLASGTREDFDQHGAEYPTFAAEAVRDSIKLSELQTVMPGLSASDVVDMPLDRVLVASEDFLGYEARWERLRRAMVNDSIGVWVPNQSPWGQGERPVPIVQALEDAGLGLKREDRDKTIPVALALQADMLGYRDDALVTYYVSEAAALADGLKEGEYHRAGYAASVPIMVAGEGKVVALRDVWAMPDLRRTISPESALWLKPGDDPQSLVVDYLRERMAYRDKLTESLGRLDAWIADPKLLAEESSDMVWGEVAVFAEGYELAERHSNLADGVFGETETALERSERGGWRLRKLGAIDNGVYEALALSAEKLGIESKEKVLDTLLGARLLWQKMVNAEVAAERAAAMAQAKAVDEAKAPISFVKQGDYWNYSGARAREVAQALEVATTTRNGLESVGFPEHGRERAVQALEDAGISIVLEDGSLRLDATDKRKHVDVGEKIGGARKDYAKRALGRDDLDGLNDLEIKLHVSKQNIWPPLDYAAMRERGMDAKVAMALKLVKDSINTAPAVLRGQDARECAAKYVEAVGKFRDIFEGVTTEVDFGNAVIEAKEYAGDGDSQLIYGGDTWFQLGRNTSKLLWSNVIWQAEQKIQRATREWNPQTQRIEYREPWTALVKQRKTATDAEVAERKRKAELDKELHVPHLASVKRFGEDWREGRDVTAEELLDQFGFRAIEYGEWLPQKERQEVINMAYDSFADLAQALNLRPKDVSLGGELAVAFGARGTGGRGAALAHFEPGRFVLNMTRMKGAGSLAHEWFHAFDRKMAVDMGTGLYASESKAPHLKALGVLATRMSWRNATPEELAEQSARGAARSKSNAESWLGGIPPEKRGEAMADLSHVLESVRGQIEQRVNTIVGAAGKNPYRPVVGESGVIGFNLLSDLAADVRSEMVAKWRGQLGKDAPKALQGNAWHFCKHVGLGETVRAYVERNLPLPEELLGHPNLRKPSRFAKDAEQLDKMRSSPYWNTTRELFARAGAAYVQDKIEELGGRSDYLVYGAGDDRRVGDMTMSPNPSGEDRQALRACFDALMDEYRATLIHEATATEDMRP